MAGTSLTSPAPPKAPTMDPRDRISIRIRLRCAEGFALGPGKAELLEAIRETASIAAAGRRLGWSYWKTRRLLDEMNACFREPLVRTARGGEKGGGAVVTELGIQALATFREMERQALAALGPGAAALEAMLKAEAR